MSASQIKILPVLIAVAFLAFSVRLVDITQSGIPEFSGSAYAKDEEEKPKAKSEKEVGEEKHTEAEEPAKKSKSKKKKKDSASKWKDASDSDMDYTKVKMDMFQDLSKRRKDLDAREKQLITKEALLSAAEQELDRKYQEMTQLRKQIENLLEQQSEEEKKRIASLVKIYEGMKPKSAASIFNTLDLDVLVAVMSEMSERRLSPILAVMNPERARTVTIILAEQKKLPELPN